MRTLAAFRAPGHEVARSGRQRRNSISREVPLERSLPAFFRCPSLIIMRKPVTSTPRGPSPMRMRHRARTSVRALLPRGGSGDGRFPKASPRA